MFVGLNSLKKIFSDFEYKIEFHGNENCLAGYLPFSPTAAFWEPHYLYLVTDLSDLKQTKLPDDLTFLICTESLVCPSDLQSILAVHNLFFLKTSDIETVSTRLQNFFVRTNGIALYSESIFRATTFDYTIQDLVDISYRVFNNPIFVFDSAFCLIAASEDAAHKAGCFEGLLKNRYLLPSEFHIVNEKEFVHERVKRSDTPIHVKHKIFPFSQMLCSISSQKDIGHINICDTNHPFTQYDEQMMLILRDAIYQKMKTDAFARNNKGGQIEYFIRDLLNETIMTGHKNMDHMSYIRPSFSGTLYCIVIELKRSSRTINTFHIRQQFENHFSDTQTLLYDNQLIIIIQNKNKQLLTQNDYDYIRKLCQEYEIFAGISNCFFDILEIREYYKQALRSIELGVDCDEQPNLFVYADYYMQHALKVFQQKESTRTYCHPKLKLLLDYDKNHHTELAKTLYYYLINERSIAAAANAINIHRNTFSARIRQIDDLISIDYDHYEERQYLILSYEFQVLSTHNDCE